MRNPFRTALPGISYSPEPDRVENSVDSSTVLHNAVELDDAYYADSPISPYRGYVGDIDQTDRPGYAGEDKREITFQPDALPGYKFLAPAPGSTDLIAPRDTGSIPGTSYLNTMDGPVSGFAMDQFQEGNFQQLESSPPGAYGPVVGGEDYSTIVNNATWQEAFAQYSNAASDQAIAGAI